VNFWNKTKQKKTQAFCPKEPGTRPLTSNAVNTFKIFEIIERDNRVGLSTSSMDQEGLRGLLNIDRADRVFQELLRRVAAQGAELAELRALVGRCATAEVVCVLPPRNTSLYLYPL
jgi:hypothetical protein